ncbi:MAG: UDP-N-acetylmuramate dehydrogenase [Parcubacteria group bacterium]|jgi:UDP-N-acetylmuramate dehydrogenase
MLNIQKNIPLANFTTFRIGGPAKFFVEVKSEEELIEALEYAKKNNLEFFILGGGSNLLVSDDGFSGLVIKLHNTSCELQDDIIRAGAGVSIAKLIKESVEKGLVGLEWAGGLPGSLGGAIRGNAGTFGLSMKDIVESVRAYDLENQKNEEFSNAECEFAYRESIFKKKSNFIILSAVLKFRAGNKEVLQKKVQESITWRKGVFPETLSPGSFFKHTAPTEHNLKKLKELPRFSELKLHEKNTIPTGFVIEECGLKGKKIGGAMVSEKHANFIVNTGGATAQDVIMLSSFIKQQVRDKFGIELQEEVQYVGF